jgi:hypothetical protein
MAARIVLSLVFIAGPCACAGAQTDDPPPEDLVREYFLDPNPGTAPIHGEAVHATREIECNIPSWDDVHPEDVDLDWPLIRPIELLEVLDMHPLLSNVSEDVFLVADPLTSDLNPRGVCVFLATTWRGTAIDCGEHQLTEGTMIVRSAWSGSEPPLSDVFELAVARADREGVRPLGDLDVAEN